MPTSNSLVSGSQRRVAVNAPGSSSGSLAGVLRSVPVPQYAGRLNDLETVMWHEYTRARNPEDWLPHELRLLLQIVKIDAISDRALTELGMSDLSISTPQGGVKVNPVLTASMRLAQVAATLRSRLGLSVNTATAMRELGNGNAARRANVRATVYDADGPDGLLAEPVAS